MAKIFKVKSFSSEEIYDVEWQDDGNWSCTCIGNMMKPYKACDHILFAQGKETKHARRLKLRLRIMVDDYWELQKRIGSTPIGRQKELEKLFEREEKLRDKIKSKKEEYGNLLHSQRKICK